MDIKIENNISNRISKIYKSMKSACIIFIIFLSSFQQSFSQGDEYARGIINTLCSEVYHGRAYDYNSDNHSSDFIITELKKHSVKPFNKDYKQPFFISLNTFPSDNYLKIGSKEPEPGTDFVISSFSCSVSGTFELIRLDAKLIDDSVEFRKFIRRDFTGKALLVDTIGLLRKNFNDAYQLITLKNILKAKVIIKVTDEKLRFTPSQERKDITVITVRRSVVPVSAKQITVKITSKFYDRYETSNVIGYLKGKSDTCIVFTAHYDHVGHMGLNTFFPGANNNGSGIAMLLELAKHFSSQKKPNYTLVFIFFGANELGMAGSKYFTEHPLFFLKQIKFLINFDMVGTGEEGITVVNGDIFKEEFNKLCEINEQKKYLLAVKATQPIASEDHYYFYKNGVKSFTISTKGKFNECHTVYDKAENLPLTEFNDLTQLLIDFINTF